MRQFETRLSTIAILAAACHGPPPRPTAPAEPRTPTPLERVTIQPRSRSDAPSTCGRMPGDKIEERRWRYGDGNAECDRLETVWANVPQADLSCRADDECTVIATDGNCINLPLTKSAAGRPEYQKGPCGNPVSGACAGHPNVARCVGGCCTVAR